MKLLNILLIVLLPWVSVSAQTGNTVIIVNSELKVSVLDRETVQNIFLGKKNKWEDGNKIVPVTLQEGDTHRIFLKNIVNKNPSTFKNYWLAKVFTGKGIPPISFKEEAELIEYVAKTKGAIGYVSANTPIINRVKVLNITE
jgi:ABC-type phosphate transport system substrate-binding protein